MGGPEHGHGRRTEADCRTRPRDSGGPETKAVHLPSKDAPQGGAVHVEVARHDVSPRVMPSGWLVQVDVDAEALRAKNPALAAFMDAPVVARRALSARSPELVVQSEVA